MTTIMSCESMMDQARRFAYNMSISDDATDKADYMVSDIKQVLDAYCEGLDSGQDFEGEDVPGFLARHDISQIATEKWVLWESARHQPDEKGVLIPADEIEQYVVCDPSYDDFLVWPDLSPEKAQEVTLPDEWADMEYQEQIEWLEEELGEALHVKDDVIELRECLAFDLDESEFFDFEICESHPGHERLRNTNPETLIFDPEFMTESIITTPNTGTNGDKYELDYQEDPYSTDNTFGGRGEHAILYPIVTLDGQATDKVLVRYWSQWQGSELDSGEIMTPEDLMEMLGEEYPYLDSVREWLGSPRSGS